MADEKKVLPKFTTPRLRLGFPKLTEPDYGSKDYPKPDGEFSTKGVARLDDPAIKAFLAKLQPHYDQAIEQAKAEFAKLKPETRKKLKAVTENALYTELLDKETEEPTGEIEFKFARAASGTYKKGPKTGQKWTASVPIFDANGDRIVKPPQIWGGTIAKVSFEASPYFIPGTGAAGLKLSLTAVQIIELRSGGAGRSASDYGFGKEEGYEHSEGTEDDVGAEGGEDAGGTPDF